MTRSRAAIRDQWQGGGGRSLGRAFARDLPASERKEDHMRFNRGFALLAVGTAAALGEGLTTTTVALASARSGPSSFIGGFHHTSKVASTVPRNGDVNPYGVVVGPSSQGRLPKG